MRISFIAGPSSGKSTTAAWLFSELKLRGYSVELTTEYVKNWAYDKRKINEFDQWYISGKQLFYEYRFLSAGVKHIVTDSPLFLSAVYARFYHKDVDLYTPIELAVKEFEKKYPSLVIYLDRGDKPYDTSGRYQTLEQAKEIDEIVKKEMLRFYTPNQLLISNYKDRDNILNFVIKNIQ